jgi:hypothetical protein
VTIISSTLLNEVAPEILVQGILKYPVASVLAPSIVKMAKSSAFSLLETLKCPLIVDVESSIVLKKSWISTSLVSVSSMNICVADDNVALLNFRLPEPGSLSVVDVLK